MSSTHHTPYTTSSSSPNPMAVDGMVPTARTFLFRDGFRSLKAVVPRPRSTHKAEDTMGRPARTPVDSPSSPFPNVFADSDTSSSPVAHRTPLNGHFLAGFADIDMERVSEGEERYTLREGPGRAPAAPAHGIRRSREASSSPSARPMYDLHLTQRAPI
ncbi:hypothetical protein EXIGLDRAFT_48572 [Exidia glandulosa HHB12029]|uniref:Uncharacterized protein n=1 Tax=Exidia glandulosa HHB12029 TaxID=1314781 RepID=A0A165P774_EXIGL|nr:hypothetical protein EXIGLDRAFT_48572 [Exidia glandulosa HHB12029]